MAVISTDALLEQVASRSGAGTARVATADDAVDGVRPRLVAQPASAEAVAATLECAAADQLKVLVAGGCTKLAWGAPAGPVDLLLSTARLGAVVEHRHGDLTATVEAGATLDSVNARLAAHRQWLPWDPPWSDRATIGGLVATNDSGPRRHGYGTPRDSIIGVTMARVDGQVAKAGGIVVKNVAGYDLSRLMTGSFGCLGVVVTATFKLSPRPPASRTVEVAVDSLEALTPIVSDITASSLTPTAVELAWSPARLLLRFETVETAAAEQADAARAIVGARGTATVLARDDEQAVWQRHADLWSTGGTLVKLSTAPAELVPQLAWLRGAAETHGLDMAVAGRAGLGVVDARINGALDAQARVLTELRERLPIGRGSAVVRRAVPALRQRIGAWGPIGDGRPVMRAVKRRFDPADLLNAGRGPGGL